MDKFRIFLLSQHKQQSTWHEVSTVTYWDLMKWVFLTRWKFTD